MEKNVEEIRKVETKKDKLLAKIDDNKECVDKICDLLKKDTRSEKHLIDSEMRKFTQYSNPLLEAFILARQTDYQVKSKIPKRVN